MTVDKDRMQFAEMREILRSMRPFFFGVGAFSFVINLLQLTAPLSPDALPILREPSFPRRLLEQLQPVPPPQLAPAAAHVPLTGAAAPLAQPRDLAPWLLVLIMVLFALERWMATAPRRGASA